MKTVCVSQRIHVPVQQVWHVVRSGAGLDRWFPPVSSCRLEGEGVGAKRVCVIQGTEVRESIETVDDENRLFQYRIEAQTLMPVRNVLGTLQVTEISPSETQVLWLANFEMDDDMAFAQVRAGIEGMYRSGISGLAAFAKSA